jgi:hypothetical protein
VLLLIFPKKIPQETGYPRCPVLPEDIIHIGPDLRITAGGKDRGIQGKVVGGPGIQVSKKRDMREKGVFFRYLVFLVRYAGYPKPVAGISTMCSFRF